MAYCTQADLVERYGAVELAQLTDQTAGAGIDAGQVTKACDEAASLIDAYVSARYVVPLSPVPSIVKTLACTIARRLLWKERALDGSGVVKAYDDALIQIKDVAKGVARLPDSTGVEPADSGGVVCVKTSDQIFTDDVLGLMPG